MSTRPRLRRVTAENFWKTWEKQLQTTPIFSWSSSVGQLLRQASCGKSNQAYRKIAQGTGRPMQSLPQDPIDINFVLPTQNESFSSFFQDYASQVGATAFSVGIGEHPNVGQLCEAVKGQDWSPSHNSMFLAYRLHE
ncbi:hypothetical protein PCASD_22772 [Puccinia coronata f. sp. avenae]|uniref:Uncharacterized protein n=1 Tax=Puccinia coronata f. sp. avenae TaxID=200324 RepID=A0A2N5S9M2_9BASI|nr:hypothetical protein PCASD_22772 [Puccinia coronata f. sp. avenae]